VSGLLLRGGRNGQPVPGRWVVLHKITMGGGGPVDSNRTDATGHWRVRVGPVDSVAIYVVSALHDGLAYFSLPLRVTARTAAAADPLVVWDTSSSGPPVLLRRRLLTIASPKTDGSREVLEILELENPSRQTRVPQDTLQPTWTGAIPAATLQFSPQQGDFSPDAIVQRGNRVELFGPIQPEGVRQLSYRYVLGGEVHSLALPIDQPTEELDVLLEDTLSAATAPGLHSAGVQAIEGRHFARYRAESLAAGAPVRIAFPAGGFQIERIVPFLVGAVVVALGAGLWMALKGSRQPSAVSHQ
jgi:hypothetical protein